MPDMHKIGQHWMQRTIQVLCNTRTFPWKIRRPKNMQEDVSDVSDATKHRPGGQHSQPCCENSTNPIVEGVPAVV